MPVTFVAYFLWSLAHQIGYTFGDSHLYFRATQAWLTGADPWSAVYAGIRFGAWPPSLLLSVPLLPFGETGASAVWAVSGLASLAFVVRRLGLPIWWLLFPPAVEAWFAGSPDLTLICIIALGGGAIAALTKPYAIPAMLGDGRWRAVALAAALAAVTVPLLPWGVFLDRFGEINSTVAAQTFGGTAWGNPVGMVLVTITLASLGPRLGLGLATPTLWPAAQLHYSVFSMGAVRCSRVLTLALAVPAPGFAAAVVVLYAASMRLWAFAGPRMQKNQSRDGPEEGPSSTAADDHPGPVAAMPETLRPPQP